MIGFSVGGPLGAAIGAGIGAAVGFVRMLFKGADQKMIDKIQQMYGVKVEKSYAKGLVERAKGLDWGVFLSTPAIREEIALYAEMTNPRSRGGVAHPVGGNLGNRQSFRR